MHYLKYFFCLFLLLQLIACQQASPEATPPNIILIMVDDLGSADLGCYGSTAIQTPHIDRLAASGVKLTQAYSGNTVCAPARSTLMTGLHSGHTAVRGNTGGIPLPEGTQTMAKIFKAAGYATGGFGKWGLGEIGTEGVPEKQGFDRFFGYYHQIHAHDYYPKYLWDNSQKVEMPGEDGSTDSYSVYRIFEEMKSFITQNKEQPFFCYAPWTIPHNKYTIPQDDPNWNKYAKKDWTEKRKYYAAMVSLMDEQLGATIALLQELAILNNTLILFCSDNGGDQIFAEYATNGNLRGFKRDLYEGGIRVPMILSWPGKIPANTEINQAIYFPDVLPTLTEAAELSED